MWPVAAHELVVGAHAAGGGGPPHQSRSWLPSSIAGGAGASDPGSSMLFTLVESLGLKLESAKRPVDVLVITPFALMPGVVVRCRPLGLLKMADEKGDDAKVLAVPDDSVLPIYSHWRKHDDINAHRLYQIQHFFEHYKDLEPGKWVKVIEWGDGAEARRLIVEAIARAND